MKTKIIILIIAYGIFQGIKCSQGFDFNAYFPIQNTQLHDAVEQDNAPLVQHLLHQRVSPNTRNEFGNTPLHIATNENNLAMTQLLLDHHANPSIQNEDGDTPLHIAINENNLTMTQLLLDHHANPNIPNNQGNISLHHAAIASNDLEDLPFVQQYHPAIVHSLLRAGANSIAINNSNQVPATIAGNQNIKQPIQIDSERRVLNHLVPEDVTRHILSYSY